MRTLFEISVVCFEACRRCYVQKNVGFCCYWSDETSCFRGFSSKIQKTWKIWKYQKFLNWNANTFWNTCCVFWGLQKVLRTETVEFCCYWSDDTSCFRGYSPRNTENLKNLKTSKVPKLKFERFLKHMLCVLRPAEGAAYEKRDFTTMSSNYWWDDTSCFRWVSPKNIKNVKHLKT